MNKHELLSGAQHFFENHPVWTGRLGRFINALPPIEIENIRSLELGNHWLRAGGSIVFYHGPHRTYLELAIAAQRIVKPYLNPARLGIMLSDKFMGNVLESSMGLASVGVTAYAHEIGFTPIPIVQEEYITEDNEHAARKLNEASNTMAFDILSTPGGVIILVPEGHRAEENQGLQRAYRGLGPLVNASTISIGLSAVFEGVENVLPRDPKSIGDINLRARVKARIGNFATYGRAYIEAKRFRWKNPDMHGFQVADYLFRKIVNYRLPATKSGANPEGVYADENIELRPTSPENHGES